MLLRQETACLLAGLMDRLPLDDAVRAGEVDVLKHAHLAVRAAHMVGDAPQLSGLGVRHHDLAGFHIPQESGSSGVQGAALAGKNVAAARQGTDAQGPVAAGVPHGDELGGRHDDEAVSPLQHVHGLADGRLDAAHPQAVAGD